MALQAVPVRLMDITRAIPHDMARSPFHWALRPFGFNAEVTAGYIEIRRPLDDYLQTMPLSAKQRQWLRDFDGGKEVEPFTLYLMLPSDPQ